MADIRQERAALERERALLLEEAQALAEEREAQEHRAEALQRRAKLLDKAEGRGMLPDSGELMAALQRERGALALERRELKEERARLEQEAEAMANERSQLAADREELEAKFREAAAREQAVLAEERMLQRHEEAAEQQAEEMARRARDVAGNGGEAEEVLAEIRGELAAARDRLLRQTAEFQNYKARLESEERQRANRALAKLAKPLLPVLDDFQRADASTGEAARKVLEPLRRRLLDVLEGELRLKQLPSQVGKPFDPKVHEAVAIAAGDVPPDYVLQELEAGFTTADGELLRAAKVIVCSGKAS